MTPESTRDGIDGPIADADGERRLGIRVTAPPADNATSATVLKLLATHLGLASSRFALTAGATSRLKTVVINGNPIALSGMLADRLDA